MIVMKFGGSSVGSAQKLKHVAEIITKKDNMSEKKIVVLSAMEGSTNTLTAIGYALKQNDKNTAETLIDNLFQAYKQTSEDLFVEISLQNDALELLNEHFGFIKSLMHDVVTPWEEKKILAQGELLTSALFALYLKSIKTEACLIPALNFMRIDKSEEPDEFYIKQNLERELNKYPDYQLFITQGYICRDAFGEIDNLKRGGSDYTASLIGAAAGASEIQIWTDIDGVRNNDPRYVSKTHAIREFSFDEAAELAYFGAKILHPQSVQPARKQNIPVRLKNTMHPADEGTLITESEIQGEIKAVAAKDNITAVKIKSGRMLMAYGFLRKIFEVFERYRTPIDMIATSEIAVSVTIDNTEFLNDITNELKEFGTVEVDSQQAILCVVGNLIADDKGVALKILKALEDIPIRMISYGGSRHNISFLVKQTDKIPALNALNTHLFNL